MRYTDTKQCKQCGDTFNRRDSYTNRNVWDRVMFCSRKCRGESDRTSVEMSCKQCSEPMLVELNLLETKKYCSYKCRSEARKSMVVTEDTRKRLSEAQKARTDKRVGLTGEMNPRWKGGKGTERHRAMGRSEYKLWRKAVFTRDNYTCTCCSKTGSYLHADHIVRWADDESLRYEVSNGQTLCYKCHYERTFGVLNEDKALMWGVPKQFRGGVL